jgi:HprK-related kinase B
VGYDPLSRRDLTSRLRKQYPADFRMFLSFDDCVFQVETNDSRLDVRLRKYFKAFMTIPSIPDIRVTALEAPPPKIPADFTIKKPDPGKTKIKEEYVDIDGGRIVRKRLTDMLFIFGQGDNLAVGPCTENDNQVVNFINNRFIEWKLNRGGLLGHAAGVSVNGRGLALAGFSGMGKSTLALRLLSAGADFVSNDRLIVQKRARNIRMYGVAKYPRINPGTILNNEDLDGILTEKQKKLYQTLTPNELWMLEHKFDVPIDEYYGKGRFSLNATMKGLVILNWSRARKKPVIQTVRIADRPDLLGAFIKETGLFYLPANGAAAAAATQKDYMDVLSGGECFEITGGVNFDQASMFCGEILNG